MWYKNKTQSKNSDKYSYLKHLSKSNNLHFYHNHCELKLIHNVTTSTRFFQDVYERNDFAAKFSIHIFRDPRPFKYYNYFDFFDFFQFCQAKKTDYALDVGRAFHMYRKQMLKFLQPLKNLLIKVVNIRALLITEFIV